MKLQIWKLFFVFFWGVLLTDVGWVNAQNCCSCDYTIEPNVVFVDGSRLRLKAGDTVCIKAGRKSLLKLTNFKGGSTRYITFINSGGQVQIQSEDRPFGISLENCQFIRFSGTGDPRFKYGFKVSVGNPDASGISVGVGSSYFEINNVEIARAGFAGILSKTDPECNSSYNRGIFTQRGTVIRDNYIHHTKGEGIYMGSSFYNGYTTLCGGRLKTLYPHDIVGLRIFNNIVEHTGWDGIQVGCAVADCEIYNNVVTNYGSLAVETQMSGIQINNGTTGRCYNNLIRHGTGHGIVVFGTGNNLIFNNMIINPGRTYFPNDLSKQVFGILCDDRATVPGRSFNFVNNTIISPKNEGIRLLSVQSFNNRIANNVIISPGAFRLYETDNTSLTGRDAYVNVTRQGVRAMLYNNYYETNMTSARFVNPAAGNYTLAGNSPLIDEAADPRFFGISIDFANRSRIVGTEADIGAFEYGNITAARPEEENPAYLYMLNHPEDLTDKLLEEELTAEEHTLKVFPNPANQSFSLQLNQYPFTPVVEYEIRDLSGRSLRKVQLKNHSGEKLIRDIDISDLSPGMYFILMPVDNRVLVQKFEKL